MKQKNKKLADLRIRYKSLVLFYFFEILETDAIIKIDTYQYENTNWEDQLTRFNNQEITYLTTGAGIYQVKSRTSKLGWCFSTSNCDDPRDTYYIRLGAIAYDNDN